MAAVAAWGLVFTGAGGSRPAVAAPPTAAPAVAPTAAPASVHSASATIGGHPVWAHFTDPTHGDDDTIIKEFIRLVKGAPQGAVIQGSIFLLSLDSVATALVEAQDKQGVTVRVAMDGGDESKTWKGITTIKKLHNRVFCHNPKGGTSCISPDDSGLLHAKFFTFSSTRDPNGVLRSNVSWFGSANFVNPTGTQRFNNTITVYEDESLRRGLDADFADLYGQHHYTDYYDAGTPPRGYHLADAADTYFSPEAAGQTDTIVNRLNDLTPDANCRVRIAQAFVTKDRPILLSQVKKFRVGGCKVWMVIGIKDGHLDMNDTVYQELVKAGVDIHGGAVHDKTFLVYGKFGTGYAYRVYTGSQNWSASALSTNDELFAKLAPETGSVHPLYDAYYAHFNNAYDLDRCLKYDC